MLIYILKCVFTLIYLSVIDFLLYWIVVKEHSLYDIIFFSVVMDSFYGLIQDKSEENKRDFLKSKNE